MLKDLWKKLFHKNFGRSSVRNTIEELIEEDNVRDEDSLDPQEKSILSNILKIKNLTANDIMVPRVDIKAISIESPFDKISSFVASSPHTRIPVYRGTLDEVIGFIHVKDLHQYSHRREEFDGRNILRQVLFISPAMYLIDLLLQMKLTKIPMALVVDEYGGIDGLVTSWDIIREILGDLSVEDPQGEKFQLTKLSDRSLIADARLSIEEFEKEVGEILNAEERDDIETLGGFVFAVAGRIPAIDEMIEHPSGIRFKILDADNRRIKRVRIFRQPSSEEPSLENES